MRTYISFLALLIVISVNTEAQTTTDNYNKAKLALAKENYTEAVRLLNLANKEKPGDLDIQIALADAQYHKRAYYEATPLYEDLLINDADNVQYLLRLAEMYSMSPQKGKSIAYAERAAKQNPQDGESNRILARCYLEVKHYPKAIQYYRAAEQALPQDQDIPFQLAACYSLIMDHKNALKYYERSIALDPENATKSYDAANACYDANEYERALVYYQAAEDKGYFKTTSFYMNWSNACFELKDFNKGLFYLNKAKEISPYDRDINFAIADAYSSHGDYEKSRAVYDEILEINPNDAEAIYNKGMTYYKAGHTNKAEPYFNKAFEIDPSLRSLRSVKSNF